MLSDFSGLLSALLPWTMDLNLACTLESLGETNFRKTFMLGPALRDSFLTDTGDRLGLGNFKAPQGIPIC